jgi:NRPS condensation-like uncharacterized protein
MKRRLIVGERIMYAKGEMPVNCVFSISLNGTITQGALESAFDRLQAKHPLLRAVIKKEQEPYFDIQEKAAPAIVEVLPRNTDEDWIKVVEAEWKRPFDYNKAPLMRLLWLKGEEVSDILIVLPHCICDGGTIVNLMRELLAYTDNPALEPARYDSFIEAGDLVATAVLPGKGALIKARLLSNIAHGILSLITRNKKEATGNNNYMVRWSVDKMLSKELMEACKAGGTTVQAVMGTAFLMAFNKVKGKDAKNKLICPVDIRKAVPGIKEDMMFAFAPVIELSGAGKPGGEFWSLARKMKEELQQKISKLQPNHMLVLTEYFHPAADKMLKHLRTTNGSHDVTLSNMGKINIPVQYGNFTIQRVYSPSTALPWKNPNTLVVSSFEGQLDFSFISEEGFLAQDTACAIRDEAMAILKDAIHTAA